MDYSDRFSDIELNRKVENVLDKIYKSEGIRYVRSCHQDDLRGVDLYIFSPNDCSLIIDEKCATKYWDKELSTYSLELKCDSTKTGLGWFAPEENDYYLTLQYMFIWLRANDPNLSEITSVELALVDKHALQQYVLSELGSRPGLSTEKLCDEYFSGSDRNRIVINSDLRLVRSEIAPEWPVNAVLSKKKIKEFAIWHKLFKGESLQSIISTIE
jgi:hypothetical protein